MRAAVFGANGGIGKALCQELLANPRVEALYGVARTQIETQPDARYIPIEADLTDEAALARAAELTARDGALDLVIVATGLLSDGDELRPEKSWRDQSIGAFERIFAANTFGPAMVAKYFLPQLNAKNASKFAILSARVGSITDNRLGGWHAYRASKAALNMLVKTYALELARLNAQAVCVGLHPGTVATNLSAPFAGSRQRTLFTPAQGAQQLIDVLSGLVAADSGKHFDWAGEEIPA